MANPGVRRPWLNALERRLQLGHHLLTAANHLTSLDIIEPGLGCIHQSMGNFGAVWCVVMKKAGDGAGVCDVYIN